MNSNDMIAEIRDANLGYLMLAQQMIRADKATAIFRLGISSNTRYKVELTLLKCLAGLLSPTRGEVRINGHLVTEPPADMAVVFQEYGRSLFPWKTVRENVELPLRERQVGKVERHRMVDAALAAVQRRDPLLDRVQTRPQSADAVDGRHGRAVQRVDGEETCVRR